MSADRFSWCTQRSCRHRFAEEVEIGGIAIGLQRRGPAASVPAEVPGSGYGELDGLTLQCLVYGASKYAAGALVQREQAIDGVVLRQVAIKCLEGIVYAYGHGFLNDQQRFGVRRGRFQILREVELAGNADISRVVALGRML